MDRQSEPTWFAYKPGAFIVFRVNRRPLDRPDALWTRTMPADAFDHFARMLRPGHEIVTGRRFQRIWRVGGIQIDHTDKLLVGKLGWVPQGEELVPEWSPDEMDWLSATTPRAGRILPFGFDGETRLLTVMADRHSTKPSLIAAVFEQILRENERELPSEEQTSDWSIEPILDAEDFLAWLGTLDVVTSVSFTAKLPNPEPRDAFRELADRLAKRRATEHSERMVSEHEEGLIEIEEDHDFRQAIAMGEQGFATLRGRGVREGHVSRFSQRRTVATEHVEEMPPTWEGVWDLLSEMLKGRLRRFLKRDSEKA